MEKSITDITYSQFKKLAKRADPLRRPSWDEYFMLLAVKVSKRSTCVRRQIGSVLVKGRQIVSTGYNGAPAGLDSPQEVGCLRDALKIPSGERPEICRGVHSEQNAIALAAKRGISIRGATLYCTHYPCIICQKMIINAGITKLIYLNDYPTVNIVFEEAENKNLIKIEKFKGNLNF